MNPVKQDFEQKPDRHAQIRGDSIAASDEMISQIGALSALDRVKITQHAAQEMVADAIALEDVQRAIENASILEDYPNHRRGACCLLYGVDANRRDIHIVCTTANPTLIIITVYLPKPPKWVSPTQRSSR